MSTAYETPIHSGHPDYSPNMTDYECAKLLFVFQMHDGVTACISQGVDDSGFIRWTDNVVNEWIEHYESVSMALARLAVLQECAQGDWLQGFHQNPAEFTQVARKFFQETC